MNAAYEWKNTTGNFDIPNPSITQLNPYTGGVFQQATSGVTNTSARHSRVTLVLR